MELIAKVLVGDETYLVFDNIEKMEYTKYENVFIIGRGEYDLRVYYKYERPSKGFEAFAGREFDIHLTDGTIEKAKGQWWDGMLEPIMSEYDIPRSEMMHIGYSSLEQLMFSYGFFSVYIKKSTFEELLKRDVPTYKYWDYEREVVRIEKNRRQDVYVRMIKERIIHNGFRGYKKGVYRNGDGIKLKIEDFVHDSIRPHISRFEDLNAPESVRKTLSDIFKDTFEYITDLGEGKICINNYTKNKRWEFLPIIATWEQK